MAVDTPAKIAILGAGPIGLEAALYARYLGYEVEIFERHAIPAGEVLRWGHINLHTPFRELHSPLGKAALIAQDEHREFPRDDECVTGSRWHACYLHPLAQSDLLIDYLRLQTRVLQISKVEISKYDQPGEEYDRGAWDFRLLVEDPQGHQRIVTADVIFDCTGVTSQPLPVGQGGIPAAGEFTSPELSACIDYLTPDILGLDRDKFAQRTVVVVGDDPHAVDTILALHELNKQASDTQIIWLTRHARDIHSQSPLEIPRSAAACSRWKESIERVNQLALLREIDWRPELWVESLELNDEQRIVLQYGGVSEGALLCDRLICHNGFRVNHVLTAELQMHAEPLSLPIGRLLSQHQN